MAKYVIEDTTLTNIADAIREKTGKTETITLANFDTEIAAIESKDTTIEDGLIDRSLTTYTNNRITKTGEYSLAYMGNLISVDLPALTYISDYSFYYDTNLQEIDMPLVTYVGNYAFQNVTNLRIKDLSSVEFIGNSAFKSACIGGYELVLPKLTTIYPNAFDSSRLKSFSAPLLSTISKSCFQKSLISEFNCPLLTSFPSNLFDEARDLTDIDLSNVTSIGTYAFRKSGLVNVVMPLVAQIESNVFYECSGLLSVDAHVSTNISTYAFYKSAIETLILRSDTLCTLSSTNAFTNTPIASGTGYIYVPDTLVDSYKSATNWSTYASQIKPISELEASE